MLAGMGYVAFAADIYGLGTPAENMQDWMAASSTHRGNVALYMSKINAALHKVKSYKFVDSSKVAVIGYCFGGTGIVNMAILGSDVLGVVGYHSGIQPDSGVIHSQAMHPAIKIKILLHSGARDDNATHVAMLEQEFEATNATYEIIRYGSGVYHSFTEWTSNVPGQALYNARADYRSWESTKLFLTELFTGNDEILFSSSKTCHGTETTIGRLTGSSMAGVVSFASHTTIVQIWFLIIAAFACSSVSPLCVELCT